MENMRAFCEELLPIAKKNTDEYDDSKSKQEAVEAFVKRSRGLRSNLSSAVATPADGRNNVATRTDVRTDPYVVADIVDVPAGTNIYASSRFHVHAAATLGGVASRASGWADTGNISDARGRFQAYLRELLGAPHWLLERENIREVQHSSSNHAQFTIDLVNIVEDMLMRVNAGDEATAAATRSVRTLATLVSGGNQNSVVRDTLYAVLGISRARPTAPVFHSIFFMELEMRHNINGKSSVLSASVDAYAYMLRLDSVLLMRFADIYDDLDRISVEDWINANLKR